jgi:hypothetical protein
MQRILTTTNFRTHLRDRFIDAQSTQSARLAPTHLLTHEAGVDGDIREELTPTTCAKIAFDLPSTKAKSAELLFYVNADTSTQKKPMRLQVNGHVLTHRQNKERMLTGGWDRKKIAGKYLKAGTNEFVFSHSGVLHIDPFPGGHADPKPSHASRSFDGGKTWHQGALGEARAIDGEYLVRLRLKGHPPRGTLCSPVIDLVDPKNKGRIAPRLGIRRIDLIARSRLPQGTHIHFEMRSGSTPSFDPRTWTPWEKRSALQWPGRFAQWRATLETDSADKTPVLQSIALEADIKADATSLAPFTLVNFDHPKLAYSSYNFTYMGPHHRLDRLRKQYRLDEVVARGQTELEELALLRDWVHSQWLGWQSGKYPYCPSWDPIEILATTKGDWGFGMCTHYGAVFAACASALGFVARSLVVDHHCLAEVWSEELQKWILEDAGPSREYDATYELDGVLLNALELHEAIKGPKSSKKLIANKLPQNLSEPMSTHKQTFVRFAIPLRNDHLIFSEPAELHHGNGQYHYDGYLWWSDDIDPRYAEYSLQTTRPADFYWSVNQTRIYLQASEKPNALQVDLEHNAPNFSHFLVRENSGDWREEREARFEWALTKGEHQLEIRTVNAFGKKGRSASACVELK